MKILYRALFVLFIILNFQVLAENSVGSTSQETGSSQSQIAKQSDNKSLDDKQCDMKCVDERNLGYASLAVLLGFYMLVFNFTRSKFDKESDWSLGKALSETLGDGSTEKPITFIPSSSRLIAFIGSLVLIGTFLSGSFYVVWGLFNCQPMDRLDDFGKFILAGSALFAPYAVNKLSEIFKIKS